jgi:hypothetical protein
LSDESLQSFSPVIRFCMRLSFVYSLSKQHLL